MSPLKLSENPSCNPLCSACHYKDLEYSIQLDRKQKWAEKQLGRWGDCLQKIRAAPEAERLAYRSKSWMKCEFTQNSVSFGMHRSKRVPNGSVRVPRSVRVPSGSVRAPNQGVPVSDDGVRAPRVSVKWEKEFISWDTCPLHIKPIQQIIKNLRLLYSSNSQRFLQSTPEPKHSLPQELKTISQGDDPSSAWVGIWLGSPHLVIVSNEWRPQAALHSDPQLGPEIDPQFKLFKSLNWNKILVPPFDRVWYHCNPQVGRKIFGHHPILPVYGPPNSETKSDAVPNQLPDAVSAQIPKAESGANSKTKAVDPVHPIRAFRQIAQTLLTEARQKAIQALLEPQPSMVLDLYCGTGDLSLLLPPHISWIGIELSKHAAEFANTLRISRLSSNTGNTENAGNRANSCPLQEQDTQAGAPDYNPGLLHQAFVGAVEHRLRDHRVLAMIPDSYTLYLNPPRSGLTDEARESLMALIREKPPASLVYLSCSASSLSRDLTVFEELGYRVKFLQPYDFFPQTEHFETLAIMKTHS